MVPLGRRVEGGVPITDSSPPQLYRWLLNDSCNTFLVLSQDLQGAVKTIPRGSDPLPEDMEGGSEEVML